MHRLGPFAIATAALSLLAAGCFSPKFDRCAVTCGAQDECPEGLFCLNDGKCHATQDDELCSVNPGEDGSPGRDGSMPGEDGGTRPDSGGGDPDANMNLPDAGPPVRPEPGDIVISEIHKNPISAPDPDGEWFEVTNLTESTLELSGLQASDNAGSFLIDQSLLLAPGGRIVFGFNADMDTNGSVDVDFAYGNAPIPIQLANDGEDEIVIVDTTAADRVLDSVAFDSATHPSTDGTSMSLDPDLLDPLENNVPESWCDAQMLYNRDDSGTPGQANPQCLGVAARRVPR